MTELKEIRKTNRPPAIPTGDVTIPVETLLVDRHGLILFAAGDIAAIHAPLALPVVGTPLASILKPLLSADDCRALCITLASRGALQFTRNCLTISYPAKQITITGTPFAAANEPQWLLVIQDVSICHAMGQRLTTMESDMDAMLQSQEKELEEATASLIETNVALRKEIRDRQNILEALSESEKRFRDLTETTSDFIWEIDAAGIYTYASPKSVKLLGLEPQYLLGTLFFPWRKSPSADDSCRDKVTQGNPPGGFYNVEYNYIRQDGQEVTIESSGEPIFSKRHEFIGFRGIDRDVTERRIYEIELRQAKELAESANLAKSEFLANMSHELRTPLHAILSFAGYGEKRIEVADRHELLRFFQQIATSGKRLLPLINSLLDLAKLEAGKMNYVFQNLDLLTEVKSVITEIAPLAEKKRLKISIVPPDIATEAFFDQGRIGQVICNILSNGVKFSDPDTTISIAFARRIDLPNLTLLQTTISNHGVAIPANELTAIFDKFAQSSKTKTGAGGTGLGLAICKQIIEDHRGKIWADSGSDGSTRFHFTLPIKAKSEKLGQILINRGLVSREELENALHDQ
ncbi:MAG: PAS/PAC sensor hybrid histidine kinase [uncultured bacterium]|nr:MAG: PAS/PAC sensor hybrid histidine kinase [uncultured bacterium]